MAPPAEQHEVVPAVRAAKSVRHQMAPLKERLLPHLPEDWLGIRGGGHPPTRKATRLTEVHQGSVTWESRAAFMRAEPVLGDRAFSSSCSRSGHNAQTVSSAPVHTVDPRSKVCSLREWRVGTSPTRGTAADEPAAIAQRSRSVRSTDRLIPGPWDHAHTRGDADRARQPGPRPHTDAIELPPLAAPVEGRAGGATPIRSSSRARAEETRRAADRAVGDAHVAVITDETVAELYGRACSARSTAPASSRRSSRSPPASGTRRCRRRASCSTG